MGSRRVLGNDPFQRGAAERPAPGTAPADPPRPPVEGRDASRATGAVSSEGRARPGGSARAGTPSRSAGKRGASAPRPVAGKSGAPARGRAASPASEKRPAPGVAAPGPTRPSAPGARSAPPPGDPSPTPGFAPGPRLSSATRPADAPGRAPSAQGSAPEDTSGSTLRWTPLPSPPTPVPAEPERPEVLPSAGGGSLVDALREAPGLLAEAWSALEAALRAVRAGLGTGGGEQLDVYGRDTRLSEAVAPLVDFLYSRWFRVEVEGAAHVPPGGALLVANHAGALPLDGPMLHEALRRERPDLPEARWLAEDQVFYAPLLGTLFNRLGAVRASPDSAVRLLAEGRPVLVFPEGIQGIGKPFRDRYRLQRFGRGGFVKLALRTGRPILPVAIMGAEETLPLLGKLPGGLLGVPYVPVTPVPLPAKWRIRLGEPISVPAGAKETDLSVVESLVDATRNTIEHMLRELLGARGGVFLG